jgi:predicted TIM-barrel enzyme
MLAASMGFLPTTSGAATGQPADRNKLGAMRAALGSGPLGIASGVTPENVAAHRGLVTHILVSTGISNSFYTFDEESLRSLIEKAHA